MRFPLKAIPSGLAVPILQGLLRGMWWTAGSCTHVCWLGSFEYDKRIAFQRAVKEGSVVFDIGANAGFYTQLASVLVGSRGKVVAVEPVPRNIRHVKSHLQMNRITNVRVIAAAVSDSDGECRFDDGPTFSTGHISAEGNLWTRTVTFDSLVSTGTIPLPTHIKIDVEGAELGVVRGAASVLQRHKPALFLATHGRELLRQCCEFLHSLGYSLGSMTGVPIDQTDEILAEAPPQSCCS